MERKVPSAPEMEELGKDEGVVPEAQAPPVLKACPVVVKKIKTQQLKVPQGEEQPPPQVVEHFMVHPYTQGELVDLGSGLGRSLPRQHQLGSSICGT